MPQSTLLAVAASEAVSASVTVAAGAKARIGLFDGLATPVNAAFSTATTGGTLAAATYWYRVTALSAQGETLASTETSQVTTGATSTVTVNWTAVAGATGYKVYGRTTGAQQLLATVGAVTTWIDTGAVAPSGALPTINSTASGAPATAAADVHLLTPGAATLVCSLSQAKPSIVLEGPGTWRVTRRVGAAFGVFSDT